MKNLRSVLSGGWGGVGLWYLLHFLVESNEAFTTVLGLAGLFISALIAFLTLNKHPWGTWVITIAATFMGFLSLFMVFATPVSGSLALTLCVVTIIFTWLKTTRAELKTKVESPALKSFLIVIIGAAFLTAALGFAVKEIKNVQLSVKKMRLESKCQDVNVDIEDCGQLGIAQTTSPANEKELVAGRELLDLMCKNGPWRVVTPSLRA